VALATTVAGCGGVSVKVDLTARSSHVDPIVLGRHNPFDPTAIGFGKVKPREVYLGGSGSGLVRNIHWYSWGGKRALGWGEGHYSPPGHSNAEGISEAANIVAFRVGECNGRRAYKAIEWYFPEHGGHFDPRNASNVCEHEPDAAEQRAEKKHKQAEETDEQEISEAKQLAERTGSAVTCEEVVKRVDGRRHQAESGPPICKWAAEKGREDNEASER